MENGTLELIFRKYNGEVIAFFNDIPASYGNILCYSHFGQHSEATIEFYHKTKKVEEKEYFPLLCELRKIYEGFNIVVKYKMNYDKLNKFWV